MTGRWLDATAIASLQKGVAMKISSILFGSLAAAVLVAGAGAPANAGASNACAMLSLAEVRSLVGAPVSVFQAGSSAPSTRGDTTFTTCTYTMMANGHVAAGRSATFSLMWAPAAKLAQTSRFYATDPHKRPTAIKGGLIVLSWVGNGAVGDWPADQKLLAAVLQRL